MKQWLRDHWPGLVFAMAGVLFLAFLCCVAWQMGLRTWPFGFAGQSGEWFAAWAARAAVLNVYVDFGGFSIVIASGLVAVYEYRQMRGAAERKPKLSIVEETEGTSVLFAPSEKDLASPREPRDGRRSALSRRA